VGLTGALSNQPATEKLSRVNLLRKKLLREAANSPHPAKRVQLRSGAIQAAVIKVLADSPEPMQAIQIHAAVERLLSMPVSKDTVKSCLSEGARGADVRFERLGRGRYKLRD
jgi:hypothetical protein